MGFLSAFQKKPSGDRQHAIDRFSNLISAYLHRLETKGGTVADRSLTLIARSPSAAAARALAEQAKGLERQGVSTHFIFARLAPFELLTELAQALNLIAPRDGRADCVRLIKTPALLHAHEQLVLGRSSCWTGDMLRRSEENRNCLDLWEDEAPASVRLAQFAFNAIWAIAKPVPPRILADGSRIQAQRLSLPPAVAAAGLAESLLGRVTGSSATRH